MTERTGIGSILFLIAFIFFLMKISEGSGPKSSYATGTYDGNQPVISKPAETYRAPAYSCTTKSWKGPYKWDGTTYSTECK